MSDRMFISDAVAAGMGQTWRPLVRSGVTRLRDALRAFITRRELAELDARMLADIGVSHAEAATEAARLPWDDRPRRDRSRRPIRQHAMYAAWRRHVTRRRIAALDVHALKDMGVSFAAAEAEANKPFWRA